MEGPAAPDKKGSTVDATKILSSKSKPASSKVDGGACLVHIYPTGPAMGLRYSLTALPVVLGRDETCRVRLEDDSVSRRHACIQMDGDDFAIADLKSTNGTFVNDVRVERQKLRDGDYLHIGNCICRFLAGGNLEAQYHEEIHRLTIIDALTEIYNRRHLLECLSQELASSARYRRPLSLLLFDIDHFKAINDQFGLLAGDFTLRELAAFIKKTIRQEDVFGRYGGEEFGLVMPETGRQAALECAERLRALVESHVFQFENRTYQITISLGVTDVTGDEWMTTREMIRHADEQLHAAKNGGRNRVAG
jgi:two-component system, cell cycle response regulator